ncbi:unnamed protein product [Miscanthus lutarioriparius]|uniref:F-box domain-containing protein n=1 Tax=Miscanthus lutarioriparius TaxID=422564 RepID=A0A811QNJ9_9POAL|nr:unnamed protein product [Miscanthus lutarioriparius]
MLPQKAPKNASAAAADLVEGRDHISNLPDGVLQHILSFLPAQDVVRTCLLAKRWRHMWESTTVLRFVCGGLKEPGSVEEIKEFVDHLLRLRIRGGTPLDTCDFRFHLDENKDFDMSRIVLWIRISLQCKVRVLQFIFVGDNYQDILPQDDHPFFISQYLKKLELENFNEMVPRFLDFSCCPFLEDLEIVYCALARPKLISSQSLKRLTIKRVPDGILDRTTGRMLPRKAPKIASAAAAAPVEGRDHMSNLPDGVLQHILSFLPAQDVVRTCVLAKRWRHLWESSTVLRFVCGGLKEPGFVDEIQEFVDHLLRLRIHGGTPLDTCEFRLDEYCRTAAMARFILWIHIALQCKVRVLRLNYSGQFPSLDGHPFFISQYLKKLELEGLDTLPNRLLDFSCCPNLEDLEVDDCNLGDLLLISSQSLKHLTIQCC